MKNNYPTDEAEDESLAEALGRLAAESRRAQREMFWYSLAAKLVIAAFFIGVGYLIGRYWK